MMPRPTTKTTSFVLGDKLEAFVQNEIESGEYATASEVLRDALRRLMRRKARLAREHQLVDEGIASGLSPLTHEEVWEQVRRQRGARQ